MNYKNKKSTFHHSHKMLIKARIMKPVTLENVFEGVYSLFQIVCIRSVHYSLHPKRSIFKICIICRITEQMKYKKEAVTKRCSRVKVFLKIAACKSSFLLKKELFYNNFSLVFTSFFQTTILQITILQNCFFALLVLWRKLEGQF